MDTIVVGIIGIIGTSLGVLVGGAVRRAQALWEHKQNRQELLSDTKRRVYVEYLRSISESSAHAEFGHSGPSENASLLAATAEIEILCESTVSGPARRLCDTVLDVHSKKAGGCDVEKREGDANRDRLELIELFKKDLGLNRNSPMPTTA
jgi:hypothetical protein